MLNKGFYVCCYCVDFIVFCSLCDSVINIIKSVLLLSKIFIVSKCKI